MSAYTETAPTVGAHRSHIGPSSWHREVQCADCHVVPMLITAPGHLDTPPPAELVWSALADEGGTLASNLDGANCNNAYCHGASLMSGGTILAPQWTQVDGTQGACGACHSLPPGGTHPVTSATACDLCQLREDML